MLPRNLLLMLGLLWGFPLPAWWPAVEAQQATIAGRVTDEETGQPIYGARIHVLGTTLVGFSDNDGRYSIPRVDAGRQELRIVMLGYASLARSVNVEPGQSAIVHWWLHQAPFTLDQVVVTATGEQLTRELGHHVPTIKASEVVEVAPVSSLAELLAGGRVAGVTVLPSDGLPGAGARVRIRGLGSASLSNDPLLYVDGVRVNERGLPIGPFGLRGGQPSFLNDINPEEIESIEIVKGPSAATLYGTQAANGIIRITTKKGRAGSPRWNVFGEIAAVSDPTDYPAVYYSRAIGGGTCFPWQQALGQCQIDQLFVRDLTEEPESKFMRTALRQQYGAQVSGGTDAARYFLSAEWENIGGNIVMPESEKQFVIEQRGLRGEDEIPENQRFPSELTKITLRTNVGANLGSRANADLSFGFVGANYLIPQTGDNLLSVIGAAIFGTADPDAADNPWYSRRPAYGLSFTTYRNSDHFTPSGRIHWAPLDWLSVRGIVGLDYVQYRDETLQRNGEGCPFCFGSLGHRTLGRITEHKYSGELGASGSFKLRSRVRSKTSFGVQYNRDITRGLDAMGFDLPPGAETFSGAVVKDSYEFTREFRTLGMYVEQQFSWDDRLFLTGAIRIDQNSAFGKDNRSARYPKVSGSWVALEASDASWLNQLRFRAAYGQSGQQPDLLGAVTYYEGVTSAVSGEGLVPGVTLGGLGNTSLKPERSGEVEGGFDAALFSNRLNIEVTYYYKKTTDALLYRDLPGSLGATYERLENVGTVTNQGAEISLRVRAFDAEPFTWDLGFEIATNKNRLVELGDGVTPPTGFGYRNVPGYPLFSNWWPALESYTDANGDGFIDPSEVVVSDTAVFNGSTVPTRTVGFSSTMGFLQNRLRLIALVDYKGGYVSHNFNGLFQCAFIQNCRELNDPTATLEEQAKAISGRIGRGAWAEDATHVRLRELSLTYSLPGSWLRPLRMRAASVTLTARNLAIWKKEFTSWDPEISNWAGFGADGPSYTMAQQGQPRTMVFRVNLGF